MVCNYCKAQRARGYLAWLVNGVRHFLCAGCVHALRDQGLTVWFDRRA